LVNLLVRTASQGALFLPQELSNVLPVILASFRQPVAALNAMTVILDATAANKEARIALIALLAPLQPPLRVLVAIYALLVASPILQEMLFRARPVPLVDSPLHSALLFARYVLLGRMVSVKLV